MKALMLGAAAFVALPIVAGAQQPRRQQPIEIRGTVPTPQVVTVRPREVPTYDRRILVPRFYDHDFWQSILPGYLVVRQRMITGAVPGDSLAVRRDSAAAARPVVMPPPMGAPGTPPPAQPAAAPPPPTAEPGMQPSSTTRSPRADVVRDGTGRAMSSSGVRPTPDDESR